MNILIIITGFLLIQSFLCLIYWKELVEMHKIYICNEISAYFLNPERNFYRFSYYFTKIDYQKGEYFGFPQYTFYPPVESIMTIINIPYIVYWHLVSNKLDILAK